MLLTVSAENASASVVVLTVRGEVDRDSCQVLEDAARGALDQGSDRLILDLTAVPFCDSAGLTTLLRLHRDAAAIRLAGVQPEVAMVLEITSLERLFERYPDAETALRAPWPAD